MLRILIVFGTRPEAIKMAPVVLELRRRPEIETVVCVTGQHRDMLDDALRVFGIEPAFDLNIMRPKQLLSAVTSVVLDRLTQLIGDLKPSRVLVHGDTTTSYATALASFYRAVPVGHVEAGLRTGNILAPWPEEFNRRSVDMIADILWAPTETAGLVLRNEGARPENVHVTGNTVVDAINLIKSKIENDSNLRAALWTRLPRLEPNKKLILVTGHRRESFGGGLAEVCEALNYLAGRKDVEIVWPVHPNPEVVRTVRSALQSRPNVHVIAPLEYVAFTALMMRAYIILTDSGGIQEEAPSLSKPVLVTRNETERPEAIAAGTAKLVGTNAQVIVDTASLLLNDSAAYFTMAGRSNPFGDGTAARRIVDSLVLRHDKTITRSTTACSDGSLQ